MAALVETRPELNLPSTPKYWRAEKEASRSLETRKIPDVWWFYLKGENLMSPFTLDTVENSIEKDSPVGQREYDAFKEAQTLVVENDSGFILWYSPEHKNKYPVPKIIISEIVKTIHTKLVFNRAIILDPQNNDAIQIVNQISGWYFIDLEEIRKHVFFFSLPEGFHWTRYLEEFIWAPEEFEQIRQGTDVKMKIRAVRKMEEILKTETRPSYVWARMQDMGMVGPNPEACPLKPSLTAVEFIFKHSLASGEKKFVKNCGNCGAVINDYIGAGYMCLHCGGVYQGC